MNAGAIGNNPGPYRMPDNPERIARLEDLARAHTAHYLEAQERILGLENHIHAIERTHQRWAPRRIRILTAALGFLSLLLGGIFFECDLPAIGMVLCVAAFIILVTAGEMDTK